MDRVGGAGAGRAEEIYRLALSLGGTITGEHGIGVTRRKYLPLALDAPRSS